MRAPVNRMRREIPRPASVFINQPIGGDTWVQLAANTSVPLMPTTCGDAPAYNGPAFNGRAIGSIVIDPTNPNIMYVRFNPCRARGSLRHRRGRCRLAPGLPPFGFWKSTDGGANFALLNAEGICLNPTLPGDAGKIQSSFGSIRGVHDIEFDPNDQQYRVRGAISGYRRDARRRLALERWWRDLDSNQERAKPGARTPIERPSLSHRSPDGLTRMYVGDGKFQHQLRRTRRACIAPTTPLHATNASFTDLTAVQQASSAPNQTINYCGDPAVGGAQCWYDNVVYSPPGKPNVVYIGGSYSYNTAGGRNNGRAFLRSSDAGVDVHRRNTGRDESDSAQSGAECANAHPDSHAIVEIPGTDSAIFGSDGGVVRTSGTFTDISSQCAGRGLDWHQPRHLPAVAISRSEFYLQSEQRSFDFTVPELVSCCR